MHLIIEYIGHTIFFEEAALQCLSHENFTFNFYMQTNLLHLHTLYSKYVFCYITFNFNYAFNFCIWKMLNQARNITTTTSRRLIIVIQLKFHYPTFKFFPASMRCDQLYGSSGRVRDKKVSWEIASLFAYMFIFLTECIFLLVIIYVYMFNFIYPPQLGRLIKFEGLRQTIKYDVLNYNQIIKLKIKKKKKN